MSDNVIKIKNDNEQCPHCKLKDYLIGEVVEFVRGRDELTPEELADHLEYVFDVAYDEGKREAYADIIGYAHHSIHETLDDVDYDKDEE